MNAYGSSELSEEVNAGVSSFPAQPNSVRKIEAESSQISITLEWDTSSATQLGVIGYLLSINDGTNEEYTTVYNGKNFPNVRKFLVSGLGTGDSYSFVVQALNFNGASLASEPVTFTICQNPGQFAEPTMPAVTRTSMTIEWAAPLEDGGCPIYTYSLYQDDGAGGALVEVDASDINNLPALRRHVRTFGTDDASKTFRFYLTAANSVGST